MCAAATAGGVITWTTAIPAGQVGARGGGANTSMRDYGFGGLFMCVCGGGRRGAWGGLHACVWWGGVMGRKYVYWGLFMCVRGGGGCGGGAASVCGGGGRKGGGLQAWGGREEGGGGGLQVCVPR